MKHLAKKKAGYSLTETAELLNEMGKMAKIGAWELDVRTMRQLWTDETYNIHDVDKATYDPNVDREVNSFTPETKPIIAGAVRDAIAHGKPYDVEAEIITPKGNHKVLRCIGNIYKKGGKVVKVYGSVQDITEMKKLDRAKTEFVSLVSHQLRTPLTAISWYTEMILGGDLGTIASGQKQYLEEIYAGSRRMVQLVNTILDVSRIELGKLETESVPVDILALAEEVIAEQGPLIGQKKLNVVRKFGHVPKFLSDPKFLHITLQNLLANAVAYTPAGGHIEVEISSSASSVLMRISDTGYGIPENQQDKIFTKLFRADNARQKDTQGTGLGLYIVKSIVSTLGGKITFQSKENKGSVFSVTIPMKLARKERVPDMPAYPVSA